MSTICSRASRDTVGSAIARAQSCRPRISVFAALRGSFLLVRLLLLRTRRNFRLATAAAAFGDGGRYQVLRAHGEATSYKQADEVIIIVKRRGDGGYDFVNEKGEVQPISFHPIAGGTSSGRRPRKRTSHRYAYVVFRIAGNEAFIYVPDATSRTRRNAREARRRRSGNSSA